MSAPLIFDSKRIKAQRQRLAQENNFPSPLHQHACDDLAERVCALEKNFPKALEVGTGSASLGRTDAAQCIDALYACDIAPAVAALASTSKAFAASEEAMPVAPESLDLIVSLMRLHHVNDLPGALLQYRRALRSGGVFLAALLGEGSLDELRATFYEAEITAGCEPQARIAPFASLQTLGNLLARAGFLHSIADIERIELRYENLGALMDALRLMGEENVLAASPKPLSEEVFALAEEIYRQRFAHKDGEICASFSLVYLIGRAAG